MSRYGCHELTLGDKDGVAASDGIHIWGGVTNAAQSLCGEEATVNATTGVNNVVVANQHVTQLQQDLRRLGFLLVGTPDGDFGRKAQFALREFQIYAKMEQVAAVRSDAPEDERVSAHLMTERGQRDGVNPVRSVYVDTLESVTNSCAYNGPVSGVLNEDTRTALEHWLDNDYRCPVVIEIWNTDVVSSTPTTLRNDAVNLWYQDEIPHAGTSRLFFRDFTSYYEWPKNADDNDIHDQEAMQILGERASYPFTGDIGGKCVPNSPSSVWAEAEITPESLLGLQNDALTDSQRATFRIVRACSEVECMGYLDSINTYDNAYLSVGPCHWTLGNRQRGNIGDGELPPYLAYLKSINQGAYEKVFINFGLDVLHEWANVTYFLGQKKYVSWIKWQMQDGTYQEIDRTDDSGVNTRHEIDVIKNWHWFYRFVMAGRTIDGYRKGMWDMARIRLRDIIETKWGSQVINFGSNQQLSIPNDTTIGDIFTSEKAIALLLRWHIRAPANVVNKDSVDAPLRNALKNAIENNPTLGWESNAIVDWGNELQEAITDEFYQQCQSTSTNGMSETTQYINNWPNWTGSRSNPRGYQLTGQLLTAPLSTESNSFDLDTTNLP